MLSVIMPVKNAAAFVGEALRSVLDQTGVDVEVIVVDDGSSDHSMDIVRDFRDARVRMVPGPRSGVAAATNAGLAHVAGSVVAHCDADDLMPPGRLAWQSAWLSCHPDFGAVCGYFTAVDAKGRHVADLARTAHAEEITAELKSGHTRTSLCTFAVRASVLKELGGMRPYFVTGQDIDLQLRLGERTRVWYEPVHTYVYRLHGTSITHSQKPATNHFFESAARAFQQQRLTRGADDLDLGCPPPPPPETTGQTFSPTEHIRSLLVGTSWVEFEWGHRARSLATAWRACAAAPGRFSSWRNMAVLAWKCTVRRRQ